MRQTAISGDTAAGVPQDPGAVDSSYGVFDIPYIGSFQPYLAPAWLDHVALLAGIAPRTVPRASLGAISVAGPVLPQPFLPGSCFALCQPAV
jgi:hypothetical protein